MRSWLGAAHVQAALRVAAVTTLIGAVIYVAVCAGLILGTRSNAVQLADRELQQHLHRSQVTPPFSSDSGAADHRASFGASYVWWIGQDGGVVNSTAGAPTLPPSLRHVTDPTTAPVDGTDYRLAGGPRDGGWVVLGVTLAFSGQILNGLIFEAALGFLPVTAAVFGIAFLIGLRSAQPIEHARRRLLEFTGDASHELRTPLQLVEAELSVALRRRRDADAYRASLERIAVEADHMRRLVDDLLWLARFDSRAGEQPPEPVSLVEASSRSVSRFAPIAAQRGLDLSLEVPDGAAPAVMAPPAWIDRLLAVLIDNACRYTPGGGSIVVAVGTGDGRTSLSVADSGPGVPAEERQRIFDRFHRATEAPGGSGLGLAIAAAIVRSSGGRWEVGTGRYGGAAFTVSWPPAGRGTPGSARRIDAPTHAPPQ